MACVATLSQAENRPEVALDTSETLFTVLAAINSCGYDSELSVSNPLRARIRGEVGAAVNASAEAQETTANLCKFYSEHQKPDASGTLAQYVSLALYLNEPPALTVKVKDVELPPDALAVVGIAPLLQAFYKQTDLNSLWQRHLPEYTELSEQYHEALSKMVFDTQIYLKLPSSGYLGHSFTMYIDPLAAPGQTNARSYGPDYYVVLSTGTNSGLKMEQVRHTYLHYLLDPMALKFPATVRRMEPLLTSVKTAPMDSTFKTDMSLLLTECMIRAVEARTTGNSKTPETVRTGMVDESMRQGFILTQYFYNALLKFEKDPAGLRTAYGDMLSDIDVGKEQKLAQQVQFAAKSEPELLHAASNNDNKLLITAEQKLSAGDIPSAQKLAQEALEQKSEDQGRALFILAEVATMNRDMTGARDYFQKAIAVAQEPKVLAWSHIYLGRIFDLQEERETALDHYKAALSAGAALPEAKAAAERGIAQPYEPPHAQQQEQQQ